MITATTIFHYRRRDRGAPVFHVWGYPVIPAIFIAAAAVLLVYSYAENLKNSLIGTALILFGLVLYPLFRKRQTGPAGIAP